jgi:hypothetical protein
MSDPVPPQPLLSRPASRSASSVAVYVALALFVVSLVVPAFWARLVWDGGWLWAWDVMLLTLDAPFFAVFPLALLAYLGSSLSFLCNRYRASVAFSIVSLVLVICVTALFASMELDEISHPHSQHAWIVGPGQVLWLICPTINLLASMARISATRKLGAQPRR